MLVHRMVKNVKNSKVLEKIRTRDAKTTDKKYQAKIYYNTRYGYDKDYVDFTAGSDSEAMSKARSFKLKKKDFVVVEEIIPDPKYPSMFNTREIGTFTKDSKTKVKDMKVTITLPELSLLFHILLISLVKIYQNILKNIKIFLYFLLKYDRIKSKKGKKKERKGNHEYKTKKLESLMSMLPEER